MADNNAVCSQVQDTISNRSQGRLASRPTLFRDTELLSQMSESNSEIQGLLA